MKVQARGSQPLAPPPASRRAETQAEQQWLGLAEGEHVGQYEVIRELGRGGMGQVFMARDTRLGRLVAIKFLTKLSQTLVKRFLVEAQATARCTHENIVVIHETNMYEGRPYMVLEYLEGKPLSVLLNEQVLSPTQAVEIMVPVVRALNRAHEHGIIHRDLKPDNIFITDAGSVKVLDFGVAKLFGELDEQGPLIDDNYNVYETLSREGRFIGTLPYMSPEQFGVDSVDERSDLYAAGIVLFRMLSGDHPIPDFSTASLMYVSRDLDRPHRSVRTVAPNAPESLVRVVDRCLRKKKSERYSSATDLLADLEALLPTRRGRRLSDDECPYPGLLAFDEADADRFFGRSQEIRRAMTHLRDQPVLAIVGPSGAGKSSFVRAGLIPELKSLGETWLTFVIRPGRAPLASCTTLIEAISGRPCLDDYNEILRYEPGYLGHALRQHARTRGQKILVLVDQFEELFTISPVEDREAFISVLLGIADDSASPLRLALSLRSDFLHRIAEHRTFASLVMRGLLVLGAPDARAMHEAIVSPAEQAGYRLESDAMLEEIVVELSRSAAPFPLLQFCLATLWNKRDRTAHTIPHEALRRMGGVPGALSTHADHTVQSMSQTAQRVARNIFRRLVTTEGTRAVVDVRDLDACGDDAAEVERVLSTLIDARLLVHHEDTGTVEIIHEALVAQWPTLRRWMDESREDTVYLEQVRAASRQWEQNQRSTGLLWRGAAALEAKRFVERHGDTSLSPRERAFLDAVIMTERRTRRRKKVALASMIVLLLLVAAGSTIATFAIREAESEARSEATRARAAETRIGEQLETVQRAEAERKKAADAAEKAAQEAQASALEAATRRNEAEMSREQLEEAFEKLEDALRRAELALDRANIARRGEEAAKRSLEEALVREQERVRKLEEQRGKIVDEL